MEDAIKVGRRDWEECCKVLEARFERPVGAEFLAGAIDLEALFRAMLPAEDDLVGRGRILIGVELRAGFAAVLEKDVEELKPGTKMADLFPGVGRRAQWAALQAGLEWKLPRIGLPVWAQYVWGAGLIGALVMLIWWPIVGTLIFFGGLILSFQVEKMAYAFQYVTLDETVDAMVRLNWPALEMGAADDLRLRLVFAEVLDSHFVPIVDLEAGFGVVLVGEAD